MSHQVVITFDIDENKVQENAEKEAGRQIASKVMQTAFGYNPEARMRSYVQDIIKELLEKNKEEIISRAVKNVTDSLCRTKAVKEKMQEVFDGKEGS